MNPNRVARFGIVSALGLFVLLYFDKKPEWGFVVFLCIVFGAALLQHLGTWRRGHLARRWMRVEARLESGTQAELSGRNRLYRVQATYSYSVQGGFYGGYYETIFRTEQEAAKLLEDLKQSRFLIRGKPNKMEQSSLLLEER